MMLNETEFYKALAEKYPDDLLFPYNDLLGLIGFESMYKLSKNFGGTTLYVPQLRKIFRDPMDKQIVGEFNGINYLQLAQRYGMCERTIRNIINSYQ